MRCNDDDECDEDLFRCGQLKVGAAEKRRGGGITGFGTSCCWRREVEVSLCRDIGGCIVHLLAELEQSVVCSELCSLERKIEINMRNRFH